MVTDGELKKKLFANRYIDSNDCWNWTKSFSVGYGKVYINNQTLSCHRIAAYLWLGLNLSDSKVFVCHICDNGRCFNPKHLFLGTQKDNIQDAIAKGRFRGGNKKKDFCQRGHPLTQENRTNPTKNSKYGKCRTCDRFCQQLRRARKKREDDK